jgi:hypothetical protein
MVQPAQVSDNGEPARDVEVCALVPVESRPSAGRIEISFEDFLEDWEHDATNRAGTDPAATRPRGSAAAGRRQSPFVLDVSSRHAPFEVWPDDLPALPAPASHAATDPDPLYNPELDRAALDKERVDQAPLSLTPDSWIPDKRKKKTNWRRPSGGTLHPLVGPHIERVARRAGGWLAIVALTLVAAAGAWRFWPRATSLRVDLADASHSPEVEVYVDGVRRCEVTPCMVQDLEPGAHQVQVVAPGRTPLPAESVTLAAGEETSVALMVSLRQGIEIETKQRDVAVVVDGVARGKLPLVLDELPAGEHVLRFTAAEHRPMEKRIVVEEGELSQLDVALEPLPPLITIHVTPADATITLKKRGEKDRTEHAGPFPRSIELSRGEWEVVAFRSGYRSAARTIVVDRGEQKISLALAAVPIDPNDIYWR